MTGGTLRILCTTDLHGQALGWDYAADAPRPGTGLAACAGLMRRLVAGADAALTLDCGDAFQGGAMGPRRTRAMAEAMRAAGIEAWAIGNHDADHGLAALRAAQGVLPAISANARHANGTPLAPGWTILERGIGGHRLRVGVVGMTAPGSTAFETGPMVASGIGAAQEARGAGADLVVALCHADAEADPEAPEPSRAARDLAASGAVDAVIAGHAHKAIAACVGDVPLAMAGMGGSHVGLIDLTLDRGAGGWRVTAAAAELHAPSPDAEDDPAVHAAAAPLHRAARRSLAAQVAQAPEALHLSATAPSTALALVAEAMRDALAAALGAAVPVAIVNAAPEATLGPGLLRRRDLMRLCPYENALLGLRMTGAALRDWLERSAAGYAPGRPLRLGGTPPWMIDLAHGPAWTVDLGAPPRVDAAGRDLGGPGRVRDLTLGGVPVGDTDTFFVGASDFRLAPIGPYPALSSLDGVRIVHRGDRPIRDLVAARLGQPAPPPAALRVAPLA